MQTTIPQNSRRNNTIEPFGGDGDAADRAEAVQYQYNLRNQLTGIKTDDGLNAEYTYDVTGYRNKKTVNGVSTKYVWNGNNIVYESGEHTVRYSYGRRRVSMTEGSNSRYYLYNGHGDTVQLANNSGTVEEDYTYDAFGNQQNYTGHTIYNPFRYCGEYTDSETGLIYLRNRYYDPTMGRFITEDPAHDGLNWYAYCDNNPVNAIDPFGLQTDKKVFCLGREMSSVAAAKVNEYLQEMRDLTNRYLPDKNDPDGVGLPFDQNYFDQMNKWNAKIDKVIEDDSKAIVLDTIVYNQGNTNYCYAYAQLTMNQN